MFPGITTRNTGIYPRIYAAGVYLGFTGRYPGYLCSCGKKSKIFDEFDLVFDSDPQA